MPAKKKEAVATVDLKLQKTEDKAQDRYTEESVEDTSVLQSTLNKTVADKSANVITQGENTDVDTTAIEAINDYIYNKTETLDSTMNIVKTKTYQAPQPTQPTLADDTVQLDVTMEISPEKPK
jgi:hypothetical protein